MPNYTAVPSLVPLLASQMDAIRGHFPTHPEISGVLLTGSCSTGEATYRSDIDLLIILKTGKLDIGRVRRIRDEIERHFSSIGAENELRSPLPVEMTVVLSTVFQTIEPAMKTALEKAVILNDILGNLRRDLRRGAA